MTTPAYPLRGLRLWFWLLCCDVLAPLYYRRILPRLYLWCLTRAVDVEWEGYEYDEGDRGEAPF